MKRARREVAAPLGLSYLDTMFSGFGAVLLVYLIINHGIVERREHLNRNLIARTEAIENQVLDGKQKLLDLQAALTETENAERTARNEAQRLRQQVEQAQSALPEQLQTAAAGDVKVQQLETELKALEARLQRLRAQAADASANATRTIAGEGDRQYLTGLKVGGQRVLILVDASASMLGYSIIDAIRRSVMDDTVKRNAPKWQQTLAIVDWLTAHVPAASRFQLYVFNDEAVPVLSGTAGQWLDTGDGKRLSAAMDALRKIVPAKGTSLYRAFSVAATLQPAPDNIYLITDGLPTQGAQIRGGNVSGRQRLKYFTEAFKRLPSGVPVNTILLPIEGDPKAPSAFWQLARLTDGSYLDPARDWP
ncbi:MAG: VWA domain-containing protein [Gammaproteobacteria bacterium]|nr:VWA domain-containing protein [Gammaproteobacteria bacterium]